VDTEVKGYLTEFGILRKQIQEAIQGLNDEAANWHPLPKDTNSIYVILLHLLSADNFWVRQVINREEPTPRDREAEFRASGSLEEITSRWEKAWIEFEKILENLSLEQLHGAGPSLSGRRTKSRCSGVFFT
jgi:uncharacterized damage-inducible protein DinB